MEIKVTSNMKHQGKNMQCVYVNVCETDRLECVHNYLSTISFYPAKG